jgi:AcrR family transcriptional regulator
VAEDRRTQTIAAARRLLEAEGEQGLSMRRIAAELGIRAPSLYKHFADKAALETALIADGLQSLYAELQAGTSDLAGVAASYRRFALSHPHLYALMTERPLPRAELPAGAEDQAASPLQAVLPDEDQARAAWAGAHGLSILEIHGRFPPGADLDSAWAALVAAFGHEPRPTRSNDRNDRA